MFYYKGAQMYEHFLQGGWLYWALILLGLALYLPSTSVSSVFIVLYIYWPLTWLTNHRPSVVWHCWLGYLTRKIVSKMTYNVLSGMLHRTIHTYNRTYIHKFSNDVCYCVQWCMVFRVAGVGRFSILDFNRHINFSLIVAQNASGHFLEPPCII